MGHTYKNLIVHIIFSTKGRLPLLPSSIHDELYKYISGIVKNEKCQVIQINGTENHIHILTTINTSISIANLVKSIKTGSTNWFHTKNEYRRFAWQAGFGAFTVSESVKPDVVEYIKKQKEHHRKLSYEEELKKFLEKNCIQFDEKYYLN